MKLTTATYNSPLSTEGMFSNVFIEDTEYTLNRNKQMFSVTFEMYHIKNGERIVLDSSLLQFLGAAGDTATTNKTAIISIPNVNYSSQVEALPLTIQINNPEYDPNEFIQVVNPDYNSEIEGSQEFIEIPNPQFNDVEFLTTPNPEITTIPLRINIPMLEYLYANEGQFPEDYQIVDWGFPNYTDVLKYFEGGTLTDPELFINNPFARGWLLNNLYMKGEKVGVQFNFLDV